MRDLQNDMEQNGIGQNWSYPVKKTGGCPIAQTAFVYPFQLCLPIYWTLDNEPLGVLLKACPVC